MTTAQPETTSTRPYLIRALYEWCTDNGLTPHLAVRVDDSVQVPREFVKNGEIVLNVGYDATHALKMGNQFIEFRARFGGKPRDIRVPVQRVIAVYARETGQGMAFPAPPDVPDSGTTPAQSQPTPAQAAQDRVQLVPAADGRKPENGDDAPRPPPAAGGGARPALKRIK